MVQPATANKGGGRFVAFAERKRGEKMARKEFLSATKPLARSRALLAACGVAAVAKLEPAKAAFPGKNGRIAFSAFTPKRGPSPDEIFTTNPDGTGERQRTPTTPRAFNSSISVGRISGGGIETPWHWPLASVHNCGNAVS